MSDYFAALGRFVDAFSALEGAMHRAMRNKAGIDAATAQALLGEFGAKQAWDALCRLHEAEKNALPPLLARAKEHLEEMTRIRNHIIHQGATTMGGDLSVSTRDRKLPSKSKEFAISADILDRLTADLKTMRACISLWDVEAHGREDVDLAREVWSAASQSPWRYKYSSSPNRRA